MKLTPQALQQLIKEELEVILTDDEAAELFGDQLKEMLMEITDAEWRAIQAASVRPGSLTPPPEWAIDQWHRSPEGVRYGAPEYNPRAQHPWMAKPHISDWPRGGTDTRTGLKPKWAPDPHTRESPFGIMRKRAMSVPPTEAEKHAYIIQKRAEQAAAERNLGRTPISVADERAANKGTFRHLRAKAWDAEKKAAADRLNQAVLSGDDVKPPKASRAKAYAAAKAEYTNLMADRAAKEAKRIEWIRSMDAPAAEALEADLLGPADEMRAERATARERGRTRVRRTPDLSWVDQGLEVGPDGKVYRQPWAPDVGPSGTEAMSRVPIDTSPAPEGYSGRGRSKDAQQNIKGLKQGAALALAGISGYKGTQAALGPSGLDVLPTSADGEVYGVTDLGLALGKNPEMTGGTQLGPGSTQPGTRRLQARPGDPDYVEGEITYRKESLTPASLRQMVMEVVFDHGATRMPGFGRDRRSQDRRRRDTSDEKTQVSKRNTSGTDRRSQDPRRSEPRSGTRTRRGDPRRRAQRMRRAKDAADKQGRKWVPGQEHETQVTLRRQGPRSASKAPAVPPGSPDPSGLLKQAAAAQRQARRAAIKTTIKKYGVGALSGADLLFAIEGGYLGGKASQAPLSRPSPLRKKMGLAGGIPLVQDAPEYIKSGEGFVDDPRSPDWDPDEMVKNSGGWGITDIDPSAPITKHVVSRLRGQPEATPAKRMVGGEHVPASQDPEYLAKRQAEREAGMRAGGYDPDNPASLALANRNLANYVRDDAAAQEERIRQIQQMARESLTPASLRQMIMEEVASLLTEDEVPKFGPHQMSFGVPPDATKIAWSDAPEMQQSAKIQVKPPRWATGPGSIDAQVQRTRSAAEKLPSYARREYYNELNRLDRLVNTYKYGGEGTMASRYTGPGVLNDAEIADAAMKHTKEFMGPEAVAKWEAYEAGRKAAGIPHASEDLYGLTRQLKADWRGGGHDALPKTKIGQINDLSSQWNDEYQRLIAQGADEDLRQKHMRDWTQKRLAGLPQFEAPAAEALEAAAAARAQPPADLPSPRPTSRPPSRPPKGKGPAAIAGGAGYLGTAELGARTGLLPTKSSGEGYGIADLPLAFGGVGSTEADVSTLQANPEKGWNQYKSDEWNLALGRIRNESLTPASLRQMVMEELGFGERRNHRRNKMARRKNTKKIDSRYFLKEDSQLELPGMEAGPLCEPADGVDGLSSQLAQMVVDSGMPPEELNDLMELIYDKVAADLEGIGIEDEEDSDDYRRTTIGFMEALRKATLNILAEHAKGLVEAAAGPAYVDPSGESVPEEAPKAQDTEIAAAGAEGEAAAESQTTTPAQNAKQVAAQETGEEERKRSNAAAMAEQKELARYTKLAGIHGEKNT